jgi:hypothetical protein
VDDKDRVRGPHPYDAPVILRAQVKILRLKKRRSWRQVADYLATRAGLDGLNVKYAFSFIVKNEVPSSPDIRRALMLPRVMPSERKPKIRRSKRLIEYPAFRKMAREDVLSSLIPSMAPVAPRPDPSPFIGEGSRSEVE